jgi:hypothetical protein
MRASCRHRTAYRWQSFATDMFHPLTNERSEFCLMTPRPEVHGIRLDNNLTPRFDLQKVSGVKPSFRSLQKFPALFD